MLHEPSLEAILETRVQNAVARTVSDVNKFDIAPALAHLHWLLIMSLIRFKFLTLTCKAIQFGTCQRIFPQCEAQAMLFCAATLREDQKFSFEILGRQLSLTHTTVYAGYGGWQL